MRAQQDRRTNRRRTSLSQLETLESRTLLTGSTFDVTSTADSGSGSLRQAILDADALAGQQPVSIVFLMTTSDPGYDPNSGSWSFAVNSTLPTITAPGVTIDASVGPIVVPGGISVQGVTTGGDPLALIGSSQQSGVDFPDPSTTGSGSIAIGGLSIQYSDIANLSASNLASITYQTPNPGNVLSISSPIAGENQVAGTSGGLSITPLTFFADSSLILNTATNDNASSGDSITIASSGLVASGLQNVSIATGAANNTLTILASSLALPVSGGLFNFVGGSGSNTVIAQGDVNYSLSSNNLAIAGAGSIGLANVQDVQLTGGIDSTSFLVNGWTGNLGLVGGSGSTQLVIDEPGSYGGSLSLASFASTSIQIHGNFSGTITAPQTTTIQQIVIGGNDLVGSSITAGAFLPSSGSTSPAIQVIGDFGGLITASENLSIAGSGVLDSLEIDGNELASGQLWTGAIGTLTIAKDLAGLVVAQGAGTIGSIKVGGNLSGTVKAPEDPSPGSGKIGSITVGGSLTGTVSSGNISGIVIGADLLGVIIAEGAGTIGTITVGGNLSGTVTAPEDPNPGSGTIGSITVGGSLTGTVSSGKISGIVIGADLLGVIIAEGAGQIGSVQVGGNLGGQVIAAFDSTASTSAEIGSISVGGTLTGSVQAVRQIGQATFQSVGSTGSIQAGNITSSLTVGTNNGTISAGNVTSFVSQQNIGGNVQLQSVNNLSLQALSGSFSYQTSGSNGSISIGLVTSLGVLNGTSTQGPVTLGTVVGKVNLGIAGSVAYLAMAPGSELDATSIVNLTFVQDVAGLVSVSGNLQQLNVLSGSILAGAQVQAGSLGSATIGANMAGRILVTGTLGNLIVGGATPGSIQAGHIGTIAVAAGNGPVILQVQENGIERQLQAPTASDPFPLPGDVASGTLAQTTFRYFYESGSLTSPQLTVQVNNSSGSFTNSQFDLSLVTDDPIAKFNLARLDAVGRSGIGNVTVEGDILTAVSSQASAFFANDTTRAGIQLPLDKLAGVGVRDLIPAGGWINASSLQAIAAGQVGLSWGGTTIGATASAYSVQTLVSSTTRIVPASNTFRVPFTSNPNDPVGFFLDDNSSGQFDWANVAFTVQNDVTLNSSGTGNVVSISNAARGSDIALVQVGSSGLQGTPSIQKILIRGDGASLSTYLPISNSIVSTGSLGDLSLLNGQPVPNITAASIFGTITSYAAFNSTIQTTGLSTNPITGVVSATSGDFGRIYLGSGNQPIATSFVTYSGAFDGQLIVRGNLVSSLTFNGGMTGSIAVQGNIGTILPTGRLGSVTVNGNDTGSIAALGQISSDLTINGSLGKSGSILAENGILGSTTINGNLGASAKIISGGSIGNSAWGTKLTVYGSDKGIIASEGTMSLWQWMAPSPNIFANAKGTINEAAIDAVFAGWVGGQVPMTTLDSTPSSLDLDNYDDLLSMVALLHVSKKGSLSLNPVPEHRPSISGNSGQERQSSSDISPVFDLVESRVVD